MKKMVIPFSKDTDTVLAWDENSKPVRFVLEPETDFGMALKRILESSHLFASGDLNTGESFGYHVPTESNAWFEMFLSMNFPDSKIESL